MNKDFWIRQVGIETPPEISYIIFTTPRSGSTFFCETLRRTKLAGKPDEHFLAWYRFQCRPEQIHPMEAPFRMLPPILQMRRVIQKGTHANIFGVKVMYPYYSFIETSIRNLTGLRDLSSSELLEAFFPNLHYIHLSRRNKIRQAISLVRALEMGEWKKNAWTPLVQALQKIQSGAPKKKTELLYDFDKILALYKEMQRQDEEWEQYFKTFRIRPLKIVYEDLLKDIQEGITTVLRHIGQNSKMNVSIAKNVVKKQSDRINDEWAERFQRDLARITASAN